MSTRTYAGGCHCGKVRYEVDADLDAGTVKCNCSICAKTGWWGAIVQPAAFKLLSGSDNLSGYQFGSKSIHRVFCKDCGIHSFSHGNIPQIGGEFYTINLNCLDAADLSNVPVKHFDGRNDNYA